MTAAEQTSMLRPTAMLRNWTTIVGTDPVLGNEQPCRELWPVTARDQRRYFLKRLSPWRNLPVASEARILHWLSRNGVEVPEFQITDHATVVAGKADDSYVLIPRLAADRLTTAEITAAEESVGRSIARLHRVLAGYPWPVDSYTERLAETVRSDLLLPADIAERFDEYRSTVAAGIDRLPVQLVHGDLTTENVLLRRPGQVSGFIDFDHLPLAPRIWDLAKYLSRRLRLRWREDATASSGRTDSVRPLVRGYHAASPLTEQEVDALPDVVLAANLIEASYAQRISSGLLQRRKLPDHEDNLADTIGAARWQLDNLDAVREAVRSAADVRD